MSTKTKESFPMIPLRLLQELDKRYPPPIYNPDLDEAEMARKLGQNDVIKFLLEMKNKQDLKEEKATKEE